jgi:hypothetical protein
MARRPSRQARTPLWWQATYGAEDLWRLGGRTARSDDWRGEEITGVSLRLIPRLAA